MQGSKGVVRNTDKTKLVLTGEVLNLGDRYARVNYTLLCSFGSYEMLHNGSL